MDWKHLDLTDPESARWIREESGIPAVVVEALLETESRPRALIYDHGLLVILRGVNLNPGSKAEDMIAIRIWLERDRVISTGRRRLRSVDAMRERLGAAGGTVTTGDFLAGLCSQLGDYMADVVDEVEDELEKAESDVQDSASIARNSPFSVLRRRVARMRRYLAPQREALEALSRSKSELFTDPDLAALHEEANRLTLILENLDLVRERAMVAQEEFLALIAHEQNTRMLLLSIIAAVFLPLSFLTGLMGMNVAGLPGTVNPAAFWAVSLVMLGIAAVILVLLKRKGWL